MQVPAVITDILRVDLPLTIFPRYPFQVQARCRLLLLRCCVARVELAPAHELRNVVVPESPRADLHCFFAAVAIAFGESPP